MRRRDPLDIGIDDLSHTLEAALDAADVDGLEGGEQSAHDLNVLLRHRLLSISLWLDLPIAGWRVKQRRPRERRKGHGDEACLLVGDRASRNVCR